MKFGFVSAEGSINVRAIVCRGSLFGKESRACSAASLADLRAASGGGEAYLLKGCFRVGIDGGGSSNTTSAVAEEVCDRDCCMLAKFA